MLKKPITGKGGFNYAGTAHPEYFNRQYFPQVRWTPCRAQNKHNGYSYQILIILASHNIRTVCRLLSVRISGTVKTLFPRLTPPMVKTSSSAGLLKLSAVVWRTVSMISSSQSWNLTPVPQILIQVLQKQEIPFHHRPHIEPLRRQTTFTMPSNQSSILSNTVARQLDIPVVPTWESP